MGYYYSLIIRDPTQIAELKKENYICKIELKRSFEELKRLKGETQSSSPTNFEFNWDIKAADFEKIRVKGKQIIMAGVNCLGHRIYSLQPFPDTGVHKVALRINRLMKKGGSNGITFGLVTNKIKKMSCNQGILKCQEVACYSSWPDGSSKFNICGTSIQENGIYVSKTELKVGDEVQMMVNMNDFEINFTKKTRQQRPQVKISDMPFPAPFLSTPLYAYVKLFNYGDIVEII